MIVTPCTTCEGRLAAPGQARCRACEASRRWLPDAFGLPARLEPAPGGDGAALARVVPSTWRPRHALWLDAPSTAPPAAPVGPGVRRPAPCPGCGARLATHTTRCAACARDARWSPPAHAATGVAARVAARPLPPGAATCDVTPIERVAPSTWRPRHALWIDAPARAPVGQGVRRPAPCPGCGARLATHTTRCAACARDARWTPPVHAATGLAARVGARPLPPGAAPGDVTPVERVAPSTWRPRHALWIDAPTRAPVGPGVRRPAPCPGCGARLATHTTRCVACARDARWSPPVHAATGVAARVAARPLPPGTAPGDVTPIDRVAPSTWRPRHPLWIELPARFRVERDRRHAFVLGS